MELRLAPANARASFVLHAADTFDISDSENDFLFGFLRNSFACYGDNAFVIDVNLNPLSVETVILDLLFELLFNGLAFKNFTHRFACDFNKWNHAKHICTFSVIGR